MLPPQQSTWTFGANASIQDMEFNAIWVSGQLLMALCSDFLNATIFSKSNRFQICITCSAVLLIEKPHRIKIFSEYQYWDFLISVGEIDSTMGYIQLTEFLFQQYLKSIMHLIKIFCKNIRQVSKCLTYTKSNKYLLINLFP